MSLKVHPTGHATISSKELRELQKLHELGKKYWVGNLRSVLSGEKTSYGQVI